MSKIKKGKEYEKQSDESKAYMQTVIESRPKIEKRKPTMDQAPSTKRIMEMDEEAHKEHLRQILSPDYFMDLKERSKADANYERPISVQEFLLVEDTRRKAKNSVGQYEGPANTEETKQKAKDAWLFTPGVTESQMTPQEKLKLQKQKEKVELIPEFEQMKIAHKESFFSKIKRYFKGDVSEPKSWAEKIAELDKEKK